MRQASMGRRDAAAPPLVYQRFRARRPWAASSNWPEQLPCKEKVLGSNPRRSTALSEGRTGMLRKGQRPCFGSRWTGFESLRPDSRLFSSTGRAPGRHASSVRQVEPCNRPYLQYGRTEMD
jgi:hypothetical protein